MALTPADVYVLSREQFDRVAVEHKRLAFDLMTALARTLALRLRHAETELTVLQEY